MPLRDALDAIQLIHQAFEGGYQNELARKKQATDLVAQQDEMKRRNAELDIHQKEAQSALELHQAQLNNIHFENKTKIMELLKSGALPPNMQNDPLQPGAEGFQAPGGISMPALPQGQTKGPVSFGGETVDSYQLPNEVAQQQLDQQKLLMTGLQPLQTANAAAVKTAELKAEEPFKETAEKRTVAGKIAEQAPLLAQQKETARLAQEGEDRRAQINANATITGHKIQANATIYSAQLSNFVAPEQQPMLANQASLIAGGNSKLPSGKPGEAINLLLSKSGMIAPDPKDIDTLKAVPTIAETLQLVRKFNIDYGSSSDLKSYLNGKMAETQLPTDMRAALGAIHTRALTLGKTLEGVSSGKFTNKQLELINNGLVFPGADQSQNDGLVKNLDSLANDATSKALIHYNPAQRQHIIETQGLGDFIDSSGNLKAGVTKPLSPQLEQLFKDVPASSSIGGRLQKNKTVENYLKTGKFTPIYN